MRLIDADKFKKQISGMDIVNNYPADKANKICELIDCQPTAYDADKVIECFEKERNFLFDENGRCYSAGEKITIDKAIEIVKSGGVADE